MLSQFRLNVSTLMFIFLCFTKNLREIKKLNIHIIEVYFNSFITLLLKLFNINMETYESAGFESIIRIMNLRYL